MVQNMYEITTNENGEEVKNQLVSDNSIMALWVLLQKLKIKEGKECHFQPYIEILPSNAANFPCLYTDEELAYLEGSSSLLNTIK